MKRSEHAAHLAKSDPDGCEGVAVLGRFERRRSERVAGPREPGVLLYERGALPDKRALLRYRPVRLSGEPEVLVREDGVLPDPWGGMLDDVLAHPDEIAGQPSAFVRLAWADGRHPYLRVGHPCEEVGRLSQEVTEPVALVRKPDSQGEKPCPCGVTLSLLGDHPYEQDELPCVLVGMPDLFGRHRCEWEGMRCLVGWKPCLLGRFPCQRAWLRGACAGRRDRGTGCPTR
jgi:hypothetical protein